MDAMPALTQPPVLSSLDNPLTSEPSREKIEVEQLTDQELRERFEIEHTVNSILSGKWRRVGLQFPDSLLPYSVRVYNALQQDLDKQAPEGTEKQAFQLFILGDTSYGACCVDEIAAEHVSAEVVVHYGRSCLSPTARLPVVYVYTRLPLSLDHCIETFKKTYPQTEVQVILMADLPYSHHLSSLYQSLYGEGYTSLFQTSTVHAPTSLIPNRTAPDTTDISGYTLYHIGTPPASLLLSLATRLSSCYVYEPADYAPLAIPEPISPLTTTPQLGRRYALTMHLVSARIIGILVATLSVSNYGSAIGKLRQKIAKAGKQSYTIVVGKVNPAKISNFAEVDAWVVVGCWESSLIEDDNRAFHAPLVTPFELQMALKGESRIWGTEWWGGFEGVLTQDDDGEDGPNRDEDSSDEEPEFDPRTGKLVFRPKRAQVKHPTQPPAEAMALTKRSTKTDVIHIGGEASAGAAYLQQRSWTGLGSDFETEFTYRGKGATIEEGRSGIARGYTVGNEKQTR